MKFEELTVCVCPFTNCVKNIEHFVKLSKKKNAVKESKIAQKRIVIQMSK